MKENIITVVGKTPKGEIFRPSDWHLRLACLASSFSDSNKIQYSKYVMPTWSTAEGVPGLLVDKSLEDLDPDLYNFIREFVLNNDLQVRLSNGEDDQSAEGDLEYVENGTGAVYHF